MAKNGGVMMYFDNMARLTQNMSKETKFFFYMLLNMEFHEKTKMNIVHLTSNRRREIISKITPDSKDKLGLARQYLSRLCKQGRIKAASGGAYLIDPSLFGYSKFVPRDLRGRACNVYENRVYRDNGELGIEAYIITDDGERIDLT